MSVSRVRRSTTAVRSPARRNCHIRSQSSVISADVRQTALLGHASPLLRLAQQDRPRAEVARQLDVRQPVADHVGAFQVVPAREVPAEHSRAGFARRGVLLGQRAVDQDVVEMYAFALERLDNQVLNGPERLLGKRFGAEAVLIRGHDQFEAFGTNSSLPNESSW